MMVISVHVAEPPCADSRIGDVLGETVCLLVGCEQELEVASTIVLSRGYLWERAEGALPKPSRLTTPDGPTHQAERPALVGKDQSSQS